MKFKVGTVITSFMPQEFLFPFTSREVTQQPLTQQMTCPGNMDEEKVGDSQERWVEGLRKNSSKQWVL